MSPHEGFSPAEQARASEHRILEEIASGTPLAEVLAQIVFLVELTIPDALCAFHLLDPWGQRLERAVGPRLPKAYLDRLDGFPVGASAGSCGTAAFTGQPVVVADLETDPLWADCRHLAAPHGLRSCWSYPVLAPGSASPRTVLGTFAVYRCRPSTPEPTSIASITNAVHLAGIAMAHARTLAALRDSEERFRLIVENTIDAIFVHDHLGVVIDANRRALDSLGVTREELIGQTPLQFDVELTVQHLAAMGATLDSGGTVTYESRHRRADGSTFPVEVRIRRIHHPTETRTAIAVARDISERKAAEAAMRQAAGTWERAQSMAHLASWTYDATTDAFTASGDLATELHLMNEPRRTLVAKVHPADRERFDAAWEASMRGAPYEIEHRVVLDGREHWLYAVASPDGMVDGRTVRLTGVTQDVTGRRRLEDQVRQSQKMEAVGLLAGGIAHDFNNLLTVISGHSELLLSALGPDHPQRSEVTAIRDAGIRASRLTGQLLAFGRKAVVDPCVLNLNTVITSMGEMLERLLGETVKLSVRLDPRLEAVNADPGQMEQLVMNLAVNARDAMPAGGTVTVRTCNLVMGPAEARRHECEPGLYACLLVTDTGQGMSAEVKGHIFEPFFTTKERGRGTGLGLSTVFGIVRQAGGCIRVESTIDVGTEFTVQLPAALSGASDESPPAVEDEPARGRGTVLVAEDEAAVRDVVRTVLAAQGYTVLEAASGTEAVVVAVNHEAPIHLLLTDVVMPDLDGLALADRVRAVCPGIRVLFISGYADDVLTRRGVGDGHEAFLQKPFSPRALTARVQALLRV